MKRRLLLLAAAALLALPVSASAYYDQRTEAAIADEEMPVIHGELKQRMATRTGPSTKYHEPGTFYGEGRSVRIISVTYDHNNVPWVQVDMIDGAKKRRVYTGFKRIAGVDLEDIPAEVGYGVEMEMLADYKPRKGPGEDYARYSHQLHKGDRVMLCEIENGYFMVDYYEESDGKMNRFWVPGNMLKSTK